MSDEYPRYIIAQHNSEPAPPEYMYYCGVSLNTGKGTTEVALATCDKDQVMWDDNRRSARQLRSLQDAVDAFAFLETFGFENLRVFKVTLLYEPTDVSEFEHLAKVRRVTDIINQMDVKDAQYLKEIGVLDLTNVT